MNSKILVTGADGLVGSRFVELFPDPDRLVCPDFHQLDLTQTTAVGECLRSVSPVAVINFAAFTDVTLAENQRNQRDSSCWNVNVEGVRNIYSQIDPAKTHFIQVSTDMVFPGSVARRGPYTEKSAPETNPDLLTWYGYTKAEAERSLDPAVSAVLRITNPVRLAYPQKLDYFRKPLQLFDAGALYPLFSDQQISLTFIDQACLALRQILNHRLYGVFHAASSDLTTPHAIITYLLKKTRRLRTPLAQTSVTSVANPVRYPRYGGLQVGYSQTALGLKFLSAAQIVDALISQGLGA